MFENKWDLLSSRIQRYILIIYATSVGGKFSFY